MFVERKQERERDIVGCVERERERERESGVNKRERETRSEG